jgi:hypothetical protein
LMNGAPQLKEKKCKLECKLEPQHTHMSELMLPFAAQDLNEYLTLRATGLTNTSIKC